ncbi:hypothetical protein OD91_1879 [Lutibacter sp. Hel_I_33_5]|uniref:hypothetical protein n=1 Tax=Lutibacter sp. Hel_I_33_5 TaxID=1566289 RepID=UPI0011A7FC0F|nr:hypothetical protein [Lutibacter sp. Hel_I_33_5]TVZ56588.1 hypothetical protein OD91_1879 [Lutibacter sp. Hel_I_33_5]
MSIDVPTPNPENIISLETAQDWAKHWREDTSNFNIVKTKSKKDPKATKIKLGVERVKGFFIPAIDLVEALIEVFGATNLVELEEKIMSGEIGKSDGIRAYTGVEDLTKPKNIKSKNPNDLGTYEQKLMIVGVKDNKDILSERIDNNLEIKKLAEGGGNVYDLTTPCPDLCDNGSPLYN